MGWHKFKSLTCAERGLFLQLLILCKMGSDNGHVCVSSMSELAATCSVHRSTCAKFVTKLAQMATVVVSKSRHGSLDIYIPKYVHWQGLTAKDVHNEMKSGVEKSTQKSRQAEQSRAEQSKPKQSSAPTTKLEKLNQYISSHQEQIRDKATIACGSFPGDGWIRTALAEMRDYVKDNEDNPKYTMERPGGRMLNWFKTAKKIQDEKKDREKNKFNVYRSDGTHFEDAPRRSGPGSDLTALGEVVKKITGGSE